MKNFETSLKLQEIKKALEEGKSLLIEELWESTKALIASLAIETTRKNVLILTGASQEELKLFHDFAFFTSFPVVEFPAWETLPNEEAPPSPDVVGERYLILSKMANRSQPQLIISGLQASLQKLIPPQKFRKLYRVLKMGEKISFEDLVVILKEMGYRQLPVASDKGEFAIRGGIVDIFPVSSPDPYRLEFWGNEIDTIRVYDPIGQRSVRSAQEVELTPALEKELLSKSDELATLLDYLGPDTLVILDDLLTLEDRYASLMNILGKPTSTFSTLKSFLDQLSPLQTIYLTQQPIENLSEIHILEKIKGNFYSETAPIHKISFQMFDRDLQAYRWRHPFVTLDTYLTSSESQEVSSDILLQGLRLLPPDQTHMTFICNSELEQQSIKQKLKSLDVQLPPHHAFEKGYLSSGFVISETSHILFPYTEISQRYKIRRQKQRSTYHTPPSEMFQLIPGDMVVHMNHGIGRFLGFEKRPNHLGIPSEYFILEYQDQAKLYVPLDQSHLITKYIGASDVNPEMHVLGAAKWKKAKEKTELAILGYAHDLLDIYAKREIKGGFAFKPDSEDLRQFEQDFPFVETEDQIKAIVSVKDDMIMQKSMDRLICGDVGYGKTEVAMRAAFKAVTDGNKQVAVLVPTTVLAMQHFENFCERMRLFPVNIAVLSRFISSKQTKKTIEEISEGKIDIVIGTHRLISQDIKFKDLGLIIIDEEQRFGVRAKEHLKKIKSEADCLTLSATPIPRTLYMSLVGVRDMSVINTPPQDRLPITTIISEPKDETIKNALQRELARDGQAYFIHNRVDTIFEAASRLKKLLPQARIVVGHGQMSSEEIDSVFHTFKRGDADILVATTIVENGIDIPNANTILIDHAQRFGLSDLYQLRGRVGRWNRRAYAYFLISHYRSLPLNARQRLNALAESSGYGGGMKLAMRDLEIRGAGDILGTEQSGHVATIGFHLYCKLLNRTIKALKGEAIPLTHDLKIELPVDARLSDAYISESQLRMEIYYRLGEAGSEAEVDALWDEIKDRFGMPPECAIWLYHFTRLKVWATMHHFSLIKKEKVTLLIERTEGKKKTSRRIFFQLPNSPETFEQKLKETLSKEFSLSF